MDKALAPSVEEFNRITKYFGLHQHVADATHRLGHTLDLVMLRLTEVFILSVEVLQSDTLAFSPELPVTLSSRRAFRHMDIAEFSQGMRVNMIVSWLGINQ